MKVVINDHTRKISIQQNDRIVYVASMSEAIIEPIEVNWNKVVQ